MALEPKTQQILDDEGKAHAYIVRLHGAREGIRLLESILGSLGKWDDAADAATLAQGLTGSGKLWPLCMELLKYTTRDGKLVPEVAETEFQGNYGELVQAVMFALEANFGRSLATDGPFVRALKAKMPQLRGLFRGLLSAN